ncbi:hypothetical protein DPX16_17395 [Anabarilius grahami]|uniref:Uncharacterized protein n=1 Tax=Anabarilius grahami TaxID=495550 RepID=A0A3N0XZX8_ANAGA|nr:hypothetical protein DPX16_17395 [Anabarilius grahami]
MDARLPARCALLTQHDGGYLSLCKRSNNVPCLARRLLRKQRTPGGAQSILRRDLSPNPLPFFSEEASYRTMYQVTVLVVSGWVAGHPSSPGPTHRVVSRTDDITVG